MTVSVVRVGAGRDHDSGFVQFLLCTGVDLLREHVRHDLRHYATETEVEARAALARRPYVRPWRALWLVLAMSFAEEPSAEESVAGEVIVYADLLVERARNEVVAALKQQGYTDVKRRDGYSVMMHQRPHKGQVFLYDDGRGFRRQHPLRSP